MTDIQLLRLSSRILRQLYQKHHEPFEVIWRDMHPMNVVNMLDKRVSSMERDGTQRLEVVGLQGVNDESTFLVTVKRES